MAFVFKEVISDIPTSKGDTVVKELGNDALFCSTDIRQKNVQATLAACKDKFGKLDLVVKCAGVEAAFKVYNFNKTLSYLREDLKRIIDVNFKKIAACRLGLPNEFAHMDEFIVLNPMVNEEAVRVDGILRMQAQSKRSNYIRNYDDDEGGDRY
ncbi:3-hydroxyacyl-CoA dehydrogenase type-2 [Orchesella cincta]|uniref:3-hydroxyacyl-CoA dehydrogenase type-2 n=1 Tax=Orchesella cincta TaxID=48709 RepID=A0A1D2MHN1_ORCCI|nr:3-hydroxyacyl-CoA dehydrogenase type-2 [Orchesella cincta]